MNEQNQNLILDKTKDPEYVDLAKRAVEQSNDPEGWNNFLYTGDLELGTLWGVTYSQTRDSEALTRSNFDVISERLIERFGEALVCVESFQHWAWGWVEHLCVKFFEKEGAKEITMAGVCVLDWKKRLTEYPVADDEHFSNLEYEEAISNIEYFCEDREKSQAIYTWLGDNGHETSSEYVGPEAVEEAEKALFPYHWTVDGKAACISDLVKDKKYPAWDGETSFSCQGLQEQVEEQIQEFTKLIQGQKISIVRGECGHCQGQVEKAGEGETNQNSIDPL